MNPEHFHLEFYEDDNGTMPVLTWLNRLESDDMAKHDAIVYGQQVILAREGAGVCGTEFGRTLGKGLYEFRLRHTRDELQIKAESQQAGSGPSVQPVKVLIRVFFAVYGDRIVLLLGGYDKAVDDSRHRRTRQRWGCVPTLGIPPQGDACQGFATWTASSSGSTRGTTSRHRFVGRVPRPSGRG